MRNGKQPKTFIIHKKKIKRLYINSVEYTVEQDYVTVKMSLLTHEIYRR